jgi:hypothetical protein
MLKMLKSGLFFLLWLCLLPPGWSQTPSESARRAAQGGSAYVPLDLWVYPAFDRLAALGYLPSGFAAVFEFKIEILGQNPSFLMQDGSGD